MYIAVNIAAIGYYLGEGRADFNLVKHVVVPIIGAILHDPGVPLALGGVTLPILNLQLAPLARAISFVPPLVGIWMVIGIVIVLVLRSSSRDTIKRVGDVVAEA